MCANEYGSMSGLVMSVGDRESLARENGFSGSIDMVWNTQRYHGLRDGHIYMKSLQCGGYYRRWW